MQTAILDMCAIIAGRSSEHKLLHKGFAPFYEARHKYMTYNLNYNISGICTEIYFENALH